MPVPFVKETVLSPINGLGTLVKDHFIMYVKVYFWGFCSVPFVFVSVFIPLPQVVY